MLVLDHAPVAERSEQAIDEDSHEAIRVGWELELAYAAQNIVCVFLSRMQIGVPLCVVEWLSTLAG